MDNLIPSLYYSYGEYVNKKKMIPNGTDGLLPVQRRLLLTAHLIAKNKFVKTVKVLGEMAAKFHPYSLAEGTASWAVLNNVLDGSGQWGMIRGTKRIGAAAPRYTSVRANKLIEKLCFTNINHVVWEEDEMDKEPKILPTMLPICLFVKYELSTIAFGFKPEIPTYTIPDLIDRLLYLLDKGPKKVIKPNVIGCEIISGDEECEKLLTTGSGKIELKGKYKVDNKKQCVYVYGWSPRIKFEVLWNRLNNYKNWKLVTSNFIGYVDQTGDEDDTGDKFQEKDPKIKIEVTRQKDKSKIFRRLVETMESRMVFSHNYSIIAYTDRVEFVGVDTMLLNAYNNYRKSLETFLNYSVEETKNKILELQLIQKLKPYLANVMKKNEVPYDESCKTLSELSKIEVDEVKRILDKYKIRKLLVISTDISEYQKHLQIYENGLNNLDNLCIDGYMALKDS